MILPLRTMTAPTIGLGEVRPAPRRANCSARRIQRSSAEENATRQRYQSKRRVLSAENQRIVNHSHYCSVETLIFYFCQNFPVLISLCKIIRSGGSRSVVTT
jgi:hypothetical protein